MSVLIVAEHLRGEVRPITLELVSAAKELGEETAVAVIAADPASIADQVDVEDAVVAPRVHFEAGAVQAEELRIGGFVVAFIASHRFPDLILVSHNIQDVVRDF